MAIQTVCLNHFLTSFSAVKPPPSGVGDELRLDLDLEAERQRLKDAEARAQASYDQAAQAEATHPQKLPPAHLRAGAGKVLEGEHDARGRAARRITLSMTIYHAALFLALAPRGGIR